VCLGKNWEIGVKFFFVCRRWASPGICTPARLAAAAQPPRLGSPASGCPATRAAGAIPGPAGRGRRALVGRLAILRKLEAVIEEELA